MQYLLIPVGAHEHRWIAAHDHERNAPFLEYSLERAAIVIAQHEVDNRGVHMALSHMIDSLRHCARGSNRARACRRQHRRIVHGNCGFVLRNQHSFSP